MYEQGYIDYDTWKSAVAEKLVFKRTPNQEYHQEIYSYYEEVLIHDVIRDLMREKGLNYEAAEKLLPTALGLLADPERTASLGANAEKMALRDAAQVICDEVYKLV